MLTKFSRMKSSTRILTTALVLALAAGGSALAVGPERGGAAACQMGGERMAHGMQAMARLHDELKLDEKQEALWQQAEQASKASLREGHAEMRKERDEALAALSKPGADLRAVLKDMDAARESGRRQQEANRDHWLAVYDALDAAQKDKARLFFKARLERMQQGGRFAHPGPARN